MNRLLLIGDSIRRHYQPFVATELIDLISVMSPVENCEDSGNVHAHIDELLADAEADFVHLNFGLHDLRIDPGCHDPTVSAAEYAENLDDILGKVMSAGCPVIWATITPVNEARHEMARASSRRERDVDRYNGLGLEVARRHGAAVNDLYAAVMQAGRDELLSEDGVHFTKTGYAFLAEQVSRAVRSVLTPANSAMKPRPRHPIALRGTLEM